MSDGGANLVQYVVAYRVLNEVGGMLLNPDGERLAVDQRADARELVERLAADPARDITRDLVVVPGWDKAPEGLREAYERWREGVPDVVDVDDDHEAIARARKLLGLDLT